MYRSHSSQYGGQGAPLSGLRAGQAGTMLTTSPISFWGVRSHRSLCDLMRTKGLGRPPREKPWPQQQGPVPYLGRPNLSRPFQLRKMGFGVRQVRVNPTLPFKSVNKGQACARPLDIEPTTRDDQAQPLKAGGRQPPYTGVGVGMAMGKRAVENHKLGAWLSPESWGGLLGRRAAAPLRPNQGN